MASKCSFYKKSENGRSHSKLHGWRDRFSNNSRIQVDILDLLLLSEFLEIYCKEMGIKRQIEVKSNPPLKMTLTFTGQIFKSRNSTSTIKRPWKVESTGQTKSSLVRRSLSWTAGRKLQFINCIWKPSNSRIIKNHAIWPKKRSSRFENRSWAKGSKWSKLNNSFLIKISRLDMIFCIGYIVCTPTLKKKRLQSKPHFPTRLVSFSHPKKRS